MSAPRFPVFLRKMWSGGEVQDWLDRNCVEPAPPADKQDGDVIERIASFLRDRDEALTPGDANDVERTESARLIVELSDKNAAPVATSDGVQGWRLLDGVRVYTIRGAATGHRREFVALEDFQAKDAAPAPAPAVGKVRDVIHQLRTFDPKSVYNGYGMYEVMANELEEAIAGIAAAQSKGDGNG